MKKKILTMALLAFPLVCFGQNATTKDTSKDTGELSEEQIIEVAKFKAKELGFNLEDPSCYIDIYYDDTESPDFKHHLITKSIEYNGIIKKWEARLAGRNYQTVFVANMRVKEGPGDVRKFVGGPTGAWIFIDRNTGEVIAYELEDKYPTDKIGDRSGYTRF